MNMIKFVNESHSEPFKIIKKNYLSALSSDQKFIEAICISSFNNLTHEVNSRYVNLKIIDGEDLIFFSNYNSPKSQEFDAHNQISAVIFWQSINIQIRFKARIKRTSATFNQNYFSKRAEEKNALAISSHQSKTIESYESVLLNYNKIFDQEDLKKCPNYWGGFIFRPYEIEFWEGHESRINKREAFHKNDNFWERSFLQP